MKYEKISRKIKSVLKEKNTNLSLAEISNVLESFFDIIKSDVLNEKKVVIKNFGVFKPRTVKLSERKIGDKEIKIKPFTTIAFKPSKLLRKY